MKYLVKNFSVVAQRSLLFVLYLGIFLSFGFGRNFEVLGKPKAVNTTNRVISAVVECKGGKRDGKIDEVSSEKEMKDAMEACMQDGGRVQICPKNGRVISAVVECKGGKRDGKIDEVSSEKEMEDVMEACMQDGGRVQICPKNGRVISAVVECKGGKRDGNIVEASNEKEIGDAMKACIQDGGQAKICPQYKTQTKK